MFFVEAKRVYNYLLSEINSGKDLYSYDYKNLKDIKYLDRDKNEIDYHVNYIGSSILSDTITIMKDAIKGLSVLKKHGLKVGGLRFKSECNSVNLRQYGITHKFKGSKFKIQGIKKPIRVRGLNQIPDNALSADNVVVLDQWFPTSKQCSCGAKVDLKLSDRTFKCPVCGAIEDRDIHAAKNMIDFYLKYKSAGSVDSMLRKTITYKKFLVLCLDKNIIN